MNPGSQCARQTPSLFGLEASIAFHSNCWPTGLIAPNTKKKSSKGRGESAEVAAVVAALESQEVPPHRVASWLPVFALRDTGQQGLVRCSQDTEREAPRLGLLLVPNGAVGYWGEVWREQTWESEAPVA